MQSSNPDKPKLNAARRIVAAELRSYDILSKKAKLRYVKHESRHSVESRNVGPEQGYVCGHSDASGNRISLCSPCDKCSRTQQDCAEYQVALQSRLRELLAQLK